MWLASILQQLYSISWKDGRNSGAVVGNRSETSGMAFTKVFQVFCIQRAPHIPCHGDCPLEAITATQEFRWEALEEDLEIVRERQDKDVGVWVLVHSTCWHLPSGLWASCQSSSCSQSWLPHTLRNWDCAFHATTFASAWGWVQHLCLTSTRCQLFLCTSAPAEHKTVLKYYPWCSQYFGCSDLRANSDLNQCWKIISCCEGRVSAHRGDEAACPGTPAPTTPCTALWGFTIRHVAENLLSIVFLIWSCKGAFYPFISMLSPPIILILWGGLWG